MSTPASSKNKNYFSAKTMTNQQKAKAWVVCVTASLLFFYEFVQINIMNSLNPFLASDLHLNPVTISTISSVYFIANMVLLFPAGSLLDRYSTKMLIIIAMLFCTLGTFLFGLAHSLPLFLISRVLIGIGGAFCFLGAFRLATRWFQPAKLAQITGTIVTLGMLGGLLGQQPAVLLIQRYGWRHTLFIDGALGLVFIIIMLIIIKDGPCKLSLIEQHQEARQLSIFQSAKRVLRLGQVWLGAIYGCMLNLVIYVIGALWGLRFIMDTYHLPMMTASHISSCMLVGAIFGCPLIGFLGDHTYHKKVLMFCCAIISLIAMLCLIFLPQNMASLMLIFFALGFFTSAQVMAYPHAAKQIVPALQASATSIVSTCMLLSTAIMQPVFAWLLERDGTMINHKEVYHYGYALGALALCLLVSVALSMMIDIHNRKHEL